jgi:hypothetical protein
MTHTPKIVIEITPEGEAFEKDLRKELASILGDALDSLLQGQLGTLVKLYDSTGQRVGLVRYD